MRTKVKGRRSKDEGQRSKDEGRRTLDLSQIPCPIIWFHEIDFECMLIFRELLKVASGQLSLYFFLIRRVYDGYTRPLEARSRETSTIDAWQGSHNLVDGNQLWRATLVVVDTALAAVKA